MIERPASITLARMGSWLSLAIGISAAGTLHAATLVVDDDLLDDPLAVFTTIQSAVDAASHGDEVLVHPGTYVGIGNQVVDMLGKSIHLRSVAGAASTIIDGEDARRGILCGGGETTDTIIEGFTIQHGRAGTGGGLYSVNAHPSFVACIFQSNTADVDRGGAAYTYQSNLSFENCTIQNNYATTNGGGLCMLFSDATLVGVSITGNQADGDGGAIYADGSGLNLLDCTLDNNTAWDDGAGVFLSGPYQEPTFVACSISGNHGTGGYASGGGVYTKEGDPIFVDCHINNNTVSGMAYYSKGGGLYSWQSDVTMQDCDLSGNSAPGWGGGLWAYECDPVLESCSILGNTAEEGGGLAFEDHTDAVLTLCEIAGNTAENGAGVRMRTFCQPQLTACVVHDNIASIAGGGLFGGNGDYPHIGVSIFCNNQPGHLSVWSWDNQGGNCFADSCDDANGDGVPDECQCLADLNDDGVVSIDDVLALLGAWGCTDCPIEDINGDGLVDINDLLSIMANWGGC